VGVDDGNEESTLGGTLEKGEALSYARLEKDDGVLELRLAWRWEFNKKMHIYI
jgi:hypothetical protein